tara:strand:- start:13647 stop:13889 length:243 start_codon:yes stop_codon:yes gene_type:complete
MQLNERKNDMVRTEEGLRNYLLYSLRDLLSPESLAIIAASLSSPDSKHKDANRGVTWFAQAIIDDMGVENYATILDEIGL